MPKREKILISSNSKVEYGLRNVDLIERKGFVAGSPGFANEVPVDSLTGNLRDFLDKMDSVLASIPPVIGEFGVDTMTIDIEISAEGSVSLLGTGGKVSGKGGISLTLTRNPSRGTTS
ncbi:MAG TPA: hypothetical protein VKR31_12390 [Rhizomicrobium sp.]|nr:hypothetical protein [Rhizomicrobium sp.]